MSGGESAGFYHKFIYVLPLEIQLSRGKCWDPINWFNPALLLCLFQAKTWVSNIICHGSFFVLKKSHGKVFNKRFNDVFSKTVHENQHFKNYCNLGICIQNYVIA